MKKIIFMFLCAATCIATLMAVPAKRLTQTIVQPNGTEIEVILSGDEYCHYFTTTDGFRIAKNSQGVYEYVILQNNQLELSGLKALNPDMRTTEHAELLTSINQEEQRNFAVQQRMAKRNTRNKMVQQKVEVSERTKMLVILINYSDVQMAVQDPQNAFNDLLNQTGYAANGATGSVKDYYEDASFGQYLPQFDVYGPYTLPQDREYYGANDLWGDDVRAPEMIADACALADQDIDFSQYDANNDGYIDQVLVFYAGHSEAEYGPEESIWPHRWVVYPSINYDGTDEDITFDGKTVADYACFSELKGYTGTDMCGIGTFCHEFGHILGLPDLYATNYSTHNTLGSWDLMDYGPYNNDGRTPPTMSAYERFYLGWLTPTILHEAGNYELVEIQSSNQAYIITSTGEHNLDGANPDPTSFYLLENRQQTSWDTYLPGHGMLVTKVNYSATKWENNTVNNTSRSMGVEIVQADGRSSTDGDSGDTYPNGSLYTSFTPYTNYPVYNITENNGLISFAFMDSSTQSREDANCFTEMFERCTQQGTNDISSSLNNYCDNDGWSGTKIFEENGGLKLASSSSGGELTTPTLGLTGTVNVEALLSPFENDNATITLSLTGNGTLSTTQWQVTAEDVYTCSISDADASTQLTLSVEADNRFYIYAFEACNEMVSTVKQAQAQTILQILPTENGLRFENVLQPSNIRIYNAMGQLCWQQKILDAQDCPLPQGFYIVSIFNEAGQLQYSQKIVCQ